MENKLSYKLDIPCYMFDNRSLLRASSFMDIAQELATQGSFQLGFSDRQMAPHNIVWILARMSVRFNTLPPMYSTVTAQTWHRGLKGLCYIRDYRLLGENGESLVDATNFVKTIEQHQHRKIACLEEIGYQNGWITREDVLEMYEVLKKNQYGQYLKDVLDGKFIDVTQ